MESQNVYRLIEKVKAILLRMTLKKWSEGRQNGPAGGALQLHLHPLREALLVKVVAAGRSHHHSFALQGLLQTVFDCGGVDVGMRGLEDVLEANRTLIIPIVLVQMYFLFVVEIVGLEPFGDEEPRAQTRL